jgi:ABC-type uncharacterized transport system substrate-binding protein
MRNLTKAAAIAALVVAAPAAAEVTATDLQVAARALTFMEQPLRGVVRVGIVYSPGSARSAEQAQSLRALLGSGMRVGSVDLRPVLVPAAELAAANLDLLFVTEYLSPADTRLTAAVKNLPCVTTDLEQVRNGTCLMGVRSRPKVEIIVNRATAEASGVRFATVFRVMITEI